MIYTLGVTGGAGSGKTLFSTALEKLGAVRIDADQVGREVVDSSLSIREKLRTTFGSRFFDSTGFLRRRELARHVFQDPGERQKLNRIVWPELIANIRKTLDNFADHPSRMVVVDMAILFEAGVENWFDEIVLIQTSDSIRKERLLKRANWTEEDAEKCLKSQGEYGRFADRCTVVDNDQSIHNLQKAAENFYRTRMEMISKSLDF